MSSFGEKMSQIPIKEWSRSLIWSGRSDPPIFCKIPSVSHSKSIEGGWYLSDSDATELMDHFDLKKDVLIEPISSTVDQSDMNKKV